MNSSQEKEIKSLKWASILFIAVLVTPKIPLFSIDSANTIFRLDTGISIIFSSICLIWIFRRKLLISAAIALLFLLYAGTFNSNITLIQSLISSTYATLFLASIIVSKEIGRLSSYLKLINTKYLNLIFLILLSNAALAIASRLSGYSLCQDVEYAGFESTRCIIDDYGLTGAPYIFGAYSVALIVMASKIGNMKVLIIGLIMLILSDSRAFAASFIPLIIYLFIQQRKFGIWRYILLFIGLSIIPFIETKTVSGFQSGQLTDHSFVMRLMIYEDFIVWLDALKFFFGGGANAFLEFAVQYDMPGHPDNLYVRLLSEVGIIGVVLIALILINRNQIIRNKVGWKYFLFILGLTVLGFAQESLFAVKSGHILAFILGYLQNQDNINYHLPSPKVKQLSAIIIKYDKKLNKRSNTGEIKIT